MPKTHRNIFAYRHLLMLGHIITGLYTFTIQYYTEFSPPSQENCIEKYLVILGVHPRPLITPMNKVQVNCIH